ncbi:MAG: hypothetical protein H7259_01435 [Cytophagales bacterium]|nr:hypothetical protein [Cytophaga sp.]
MKKYPSLTFIGAMLMIAVMIAFPFFNISHFEPHSANKMIYHHLLIPILIASLIGAIYLYVKYLRKFKQKTPSAVKKILQHFFNIAAMFFVFSIIIDGLTLSTIVTTNAYIGPSKKITIKAEVIRYEPYRGKTGKINHYIEFKNPVGNKIIKLHVNRQYEAGELFIKEMNVGLWGQLYSMD